MLNISQLSTKYRIKKMEEEDISRILNLENGNPQYFAYCAHQIHVGKRC